MSERKVLNKYYPPDFDPSKIPRAKCSKNRQFNVRLMAPCNMKCLTCGEYIAKAKKFNARKEDVENMSYLGLRIYRFYIKCPGCLAEISFRTDPESTDYIIEAGAHRNFQALKLAEEQAARQEREEREEIESNPMLLLENRTEQSQYEMNQIETLEDLKDSNDRQANVDLESLTRKYDDQKKMTAEQLEESERAEALQALGYSYSQGKWIKRLAKEKKNDDRPSEPQKNDLPLAKKHKTESSSNSFWSKSKFNGLVKLKNKNMESNSSVKFINTILPSASENAVKCTEKIKYECESATSKINKNGLGLLSAYSDSESDHDDLNY